eukprot:superscaffoldBa00002225_g13592
MSTQQPPIHLTSPAMLSLCKPIYWSHTTGDSGEEEGVMGECGRVCNGNLFDIILGVALMLKTAGLPGSVGQSAMISLLDWYTLEHELILVLERAALSLDLYKYLQINRSSLPEHEAKMRGCLSPGHQFRKHPDSALLNWCPKTPDCNILLHMCLARDPMECATLQAIQCCPALTQPSPPVT